MVRSCIRRHLTELWLDRKLYPSFRDYVELLEVTPGKTHVEVFTAAMVHAEEHIMKYLEGDDLVMPASLETEVPQEVLNEVENAFMLGLNIPYIAVTDVEALALSGTNFLIKNLS